MNIWATRLFHTPELVALSQTKVKENFIISFHSMMLCFLGPKWIEKKRTLLQALKAELPSGGSRPIIILEQIIPEHNVFSIRQPLIRLKEMEQIFFSGAEVVITDYSKSVIKAILHEIFGYSFIQFLNLAFRIVHRSSKKYGFSRRFIHVFAYHFLPMGWRKINEIFNFTVQRILGRLICYIDLEEARPFVKDSYIVLTTEIRSGLVEDHVHIQAIKKIQ